MPKVDQLFVGARVVVKSKDEKPRFCPGIVAELPGRKNRMRFLVFLDDLTPVYVSLPFLYLVCRPLADPLDDIGDDSHKNFLKEYIKSWPYPPQIQYRVGQIINAELNGVQQTCEVLEVDCSLIQVLFRTDQCKEWLYRGSLRLEHVVIMREHFKLKQEEEQKKKSHSVNASLKSEH
ncbi:histone-lysine N-methyltransferase SETDB1-A [Symphorus nematophorus]